MKSVIFIISFSPAYKEWGDKPRPWPNWTTPNGGWVGIPALDWGDILLRALASHAPDYRCEVWQPDLRADKVYRAEFGDNFSHSNFPAVMIKRMKLGQFREEIYSDKLLQSVMKLDSPDTVFMLPVSRHTHWMRRINSAVKLGKILHYNFLNSSLMLPVRYGGKSITKAIGTFMANRIKSAWMYRVKNLLTMKDSPQALATFQALYPALRIFYFMWGYDLDYWKPVLGKKAARKDLGLPQAGFVIVLSQRLSPEYQVDRVIEALSKLKERYSFSCYITGHGLNEYEQYLHEYTARLGMAKRVHFVGFVDDETLRKYFESADLFINLPVNSAGSASALKATMTGVPVLLIPTGALYEFLTSQGAGEFVDPLDHDSWAIKISQVLEGKIQILVPSREVLAEYFSWARNIRDVRNAIENAR